MTSIRGRSADNGLRLRLPRRRRNGFFVRVINEPHRLAFGLVEQRQLRRVRLDGLFGLAPEQAVAQQLDLFFQVDDVGLISLGNFFLAVECLKQQLLEQNGIIRRGVGQANQGPDYTGSGYIAWSQNLMRAIAPKVKTVE